MWRAASAVSRAMIASVLALSCSDDASSTTSSTGGTSGTSGTTTTASSSAAETCLATINEYRRSKGLLPYKRWTDGEACADQESQSDATSQKGHGAFGKCGESAQNECPGWPGPATTMIPKCLGAMWAEGPGGGHYDAMSSKQYTQVACGFGTASDGSIWSAQNFR